MKKIMVLGASYLQTFLIKKIKEMGHICVALDGNPESEGFSCADSFYVCSTVDKDAVLKIAEKEKIDAIMTYASDVAAPTAAYVAEKLCLPTNPYNSVDIMTDKSKTRVFMQQNGFNVPESAEVNDVESARTASEKIGFPVILKPVDSSGSKGVSKAYSVDEIDNAFASAFKFSRTKRVIVEKFIERSGYQIDADCFMYNGELVFFQPMDQHQDKIAPYSPIGISAPSTLGEDKTKLAFNEVERFLKLLDMKFGQFNVEYIFDENGDMYILEIGARSGGNLIPDVITKGTGLDICCHNVLAHLGEDCSGVKNIPFTKNVTSFIYHSQKDGVFKGIQIPPEIQKGIKFSKMFVKEGDRVSKFTNGMYALGFCLIEFKDMEYMLRVLDNSAEYIKALVE